MSSPVSSGPARLPAGLVLLAGLLWGLGLARALFEQFPLALAFLGALPGALALAALAALLALGAWRGLARRGGEPAAALAPAFFPLALPIVAVFDPAVNPLRLAVLLVAGPAICLLLCAAAGGVGREAGGVGRGGWGGGRVAHYALRITFYASRFTPTALVFLIPFLLYLLTLAPTVGEADTFEFQVDIVRLAVAHPSGYPLYILIGKLFSLLPLPGSVAYRINLSSAFFGGVAALGVYAIVRTLAQMGGEAGKGTEANARAGLGRAWAQIPALIAGLTFGLSFGLWSRAVEAEVYTLHAAFVAAILLVMLGILYRSHSISLLALLLGLSLANHLTTALLAPAALAALLIARPRLPRKTWLAAAGLFALGLSVYLYIPIRWPAVNDGEVMSLAQFAAYLTGRQAQGALRLDAWLADPGRYAIVGGKALAEFGWAGVLLALAGLAWLLLRRATRPAALVLGLAYAAYFYFGLSFYVPDPDFSAFLLPAHLVQCALIGVGAFAVMRGAGRVERGAWRVEGGRQAAAQLAGSAERLTHYGLRITSYILRFTRQYNNWLSVVASSAFILLPSSLVWLNYSRVDQSRDWGKYELGRYLLSQPLAQGALVLADSEKIAPLYYLQVAEGVRPDLTISVLPDETAYRAALDEAIAQGRTVYLGRYLPGLQGFFHLRSAGPLTEVGVAPLAAAPPAAVSSGALFGGAVRLIGVEPDATEAEAGGPLRLTLFWGAEGPTDHNYLVRLRLVDGEGRAAQETLGRLPANGYYPTNAWRPGEIVPDFYQIDLDAALAPGEYAVQVGLFPPFSEDGLPVEGGGGRGQADRWATVMHVRVTAASRPPEASVPVRFVFPPLPTANLPSGEGPGVRVIGYDLPESAAPGSNVTASFFWVASGRQPQGVAPTDEIRYSLIAPGGAPIAEASFDPARWPPGAVIKTQLTFKAPAQAGPLGLRLSVPGRDARCGWLRPAAESCHLRSLLVEGEAIAPGAVNFADKILLRSLALETPEARPGEIVRVTLEWQALASMTDDYTAFVHLLGPDGLVHGQVDAWPVQGTRPTSGWRPGERLLDTYEIRVPDDAPPGAYEVEVGWYLLATLERLPVLGEGGAVVDDRVLRGGLTVR